MSGFFHHSPSFGFPSRVGVGGKGRLIRLPEHKGLEILELTHCTALHRSANSNADHCSDLPRCAQVRGKRELEICFPDSKSRTLFYNTIVSLIKYSACISVIDKMWPYLTRRLKREHIKLGDKFK